MVAGSSEFVSVSVYISEFQKKNKTGTLYQGVVFDVGDYVLEI